MTELPLSLDILENDLNYKTDMRSDCYPLVIRLYVLDYHPYCTKMPKLQ